MSSSNPPGQDLLRSPFRYRVNLNTPLALSVARIFIPICFGMYSLWLGADSNWDLFNYHLYNPFAWLHGKWLLDIAPAGLQSYFNPLLDLVFYWANTHLPSRLVGFALGWLHGLSFVLILAIAQRVLTGLPESDRYRVPLLLAVAGCLTGNFLSGLGNLMGDDSTALLVLSGLFVLLANWERLATATPRSIAAAIAGGIVLGLGVGLKLTNAVFAVALCVALLSYPGGVAARLRVSVCFGIGVLIGLALTGGYWFVHMWKLFGNPLYPQFGGLFPNPMTQAGGAGDSRWGPHGAWESVLWPIIITLDSGRVSEIPIRQIVWALVYLLLLAWGVGQVSGRLKSAARSAFDPRARLIVVFVVVGFVVWMRLFSIYRYVVPIEALTPLVIWILLHRLLRPEAARRAAKWILVAATAVVVTGGARTWGHEGWSDPLYHAQLPEVSQPARATVILSSQHRRAWAWLATFFPPEIAFMQLDSSFPGTSLFLAHMRDTARSRGGPIYAVVDGEYDWRADSVARVGRFVERIGMTRGERGCAVLREAVTRLHLHASVVSTPHSARACELAERADDAERFQRENQDDLKQAALAFERDGFELDVSSCERYVAGVGTGHVSYQWCRVSLR
ncbi:hypothetical protein FAZ95_20600 [Trinickia violacea]|uniref:DUF2029 domain-containing protein n=1 Tax=Trinickia violacea TaxID=2571746 RepID=A0A4P8IZG5_9BURK|nr:hypothetical protein [Trinickia violacea]QCP51339.1 hypothetical protein FAZ95_20600 [Trinickia violacea]